MIKYTAAASSSGDGRNGRVRSSDGVIDLPLRMPKELGGEGGTTNPEQLFAAAYSACFHSALRVAAEEQGVQLQNDTVDAEVGIGPEGESFALAVMLNAHVPGVDQSQANALAKRAHELCPYSKATHGNIDVTVRATT